MPVLLLRHASAGSRDGWDGNDRRRPLDEAGRRQAAALAEALGHYGVTRIVSSPYTRCVETVEPLAALAGVAVEERDELAEGASVVAALRVLRDVSQGTAVVCTHRDVIAGLIGPERPCRKGAAWILEPEGDRFAPAVYLPEP
jgi:8-oxo-dGTP diphosphatase